MHIQLVSEPEARSDVDDHGAQEAAARTPLVAAGQAHAGQEASPLNAVINIQKHFCHVSQISLEEKKTATALVHVRRERLRS